MTPDNSTPKVSVVVPCYNESENLVPAAQRLDHVFSQLNDCVYECIFVDDGSTDDTADRLGRLERENPSVHAIHLPRNMGQSAALVAGMRSARGDYILTMDGDLQNDPCDFPRILELLERYDCVCGYRVKRNDSWIRRASSRIANFARNAVLGDGIRDTGCGTKGFRRACVEYVVPFNGVHRYFAVLMIAAGFSVVECPVAHHPRLHGVSKYGVGNRLWRGLFDLIGVTWLKRRYLFELAALAGVRGQSFSDSQAPSDYVIASHESWRPKST